MKKTACCLGLWMLVSAGIAGAGEVMIPYVSSESDDGVVRQTRVWVSNPSSAQKSFTVTFFAEGRDGSTTSPLPGSFAVGPGKTTALVGVAPQGQSGMLMISGAAELVASARLEASISTGTFVLHDLPAVSIGNALAANTVAALQGLQRTDAQNTVGTAANQRTNLVILNLTRQPALCTVRAFRADASQIASTVSLPLLPLSQLQFDDALSLLGVPAITDARLTVSCNQTFYTFATVTTLRSAQTAFVAPSASLAGDLVPTGAAGVVTFTQPGAFLVVTSADTFASFSLPTPVGARYKKATVDFDLFSQKFPPLLFTGITSFRRPSDKRADRILYYGVQLVNAKARTTLDLGANELTAKGDGPWKENHAYHLKITYDLTPGVKKVTFQTFDGATQTSSLSGPAQHFDLVATDGHPLVVDFGQVGIGDFAYAPPEPGWRFSNLRVVLEPE